MKMNKKNNAEVKQTALVSSSFGSFSFFVSRRAYVSFILVVQILCPLARKVEVAMKQSLEK